MYNSGHKLQSSKHLHLSLSSETVPSIGSSDHHGILATFACDTGRSSPLVPRRIWRYKYADYELGNDMLLELDPSDIIVNAGAAEGK